MIQYKIISKWVINFFDFQKSSDISVLGDYFINLILILTSLIVERY